MYLTSCNLDDRKHFRALGHFFCRAFQVVRARQSHRRARRTLSNPGGTRDGMHSCNDYRPPGHARLTFSLSPRIKLPPGAVAAREEANGGRAEGAATVLEKGTVAVDSEDSAAACRHTRCILRTSMPRCRPRNAIGCAVRCNRDSSTAPEARDCRAYHRFAYSTGRSDWLGGR